MNRQFPALRGFAIFLVVVNHSITLGLQAARQAGFDLGQIEKVILLAVKEVGILAVPIFLFLAGSFFVYAVQGKDLKASYRIVWNSVFHILVPYVIWSAIYYGVVFLLRGEQYSLAGYAKNLLVGYPYNFVPILVFFYLIAPILIRAARQFPGFVIVVFGIIQAINIVVLKPELLSFELPGWVRVLSPPVLALPFAVWGVFYPLGIIYGCHAARITPILKRYAWISLLVTLVLYGLATANLLTAVNAVLAEVFCPLAAILLAPVIPRNRIPAVKFLENLGKRSYGLYLTNLVVINLLLFAVQSWLPFLLGWLSLLSIVLAAITFVLPGWLMSAVERIPGRSVYRAVFG